MKTKNGMPSGIGSPYCAATKSKPIPLTGIGFSQSILRLLMVLLVLPMAWVNAYGLASSYVKTVTAATAEGLVYCNKSNTVTPSDSDYKRYYPGGSGTGSSNASCYVNLGAAKSGVYIYCWAKPARGYEFDHWDGYEKGYLPYGDQNKSKLLDIDSWNGVNDRMVGTCGNGESTYKAHTAYFKPAASFTITYTPPIGGSYNVHYSYLKTREKAGEEYEFYPATEEYDMTADLEEDQAVTSYAADVITLSVPSETTNFIGWYENDVKIEDSETKKTLTYTAHADVTIEPKFKELAWGDVTGDLTITETAQDAQKREEDNPHNGIIYVAIPTLIGTWTAADFTVTPVNTSNSFGSIAIGTVSLDLVSNRLVIPYTYTATNWGGVEANLTITPSFGATKEISITCSAEEKVNYEACIEVNKERVETGDLVDMINIANGNTYENPVVKLMNNKTITAPLSFTNSFTFDVNGNVLTANCASAFSINAAGVDVQIIDGSFTQVGEIHTSHSSSGNVNVVTFTQAAKLTMLGGTLSAENTGSGSAYGVDVRNGSIFYMTGGDLTVTASSGDARGANIATASDYATFNGGTITVSAPTNAYGMWSAGQSNITNAAITVETTTGTNAYGLYVNGGTSTITTTNFAVNAKTTNAYGAYINAGRLNFNGGKLNVEAETSGVYGVHVASGATAMLQQNAKVTAEATGASGTNVVGINNLGTVSLKNISVTATSPTNNATAVNSATSAVSTTIEDGTYTANTETGYAYGLHHQYGALNVDGGTFKGIVKTSGTNAYGARAAADATIANATIYAETKGSANTAYGFVGGVAGKTITLTNCDITAKSNTNKAYAIYSRTGVTASGCTLTATTSGTDLAYGIYAEAGTNALTNCNATVSVNTISSYGAYHKAGSLSIIGGVYNVEAKQATATAAQYTMLYGLYNEAGMTTTVTGTAFNVTATNASYAQYVYGAYINGTLNSTSTTYNVTACRYVYGMQGMGSSNLVLANNTIRVEATNANTANNNSSWSYGIYAKKNFTINGDKVDAIGQIKDVYAMYFESNSLGNVLDGKFSAQGNGTNGYGALNASATVGNVYLKGGVYKSAINLAKYAYTDYKVYNMDASHPDYADGYRYTIATENPSPYVCRIVGGAYYATLKEALQYTLDNSGNYTIVMTQPHTLPAGEYTLPANATLVIPYKFDQNAITVQGSNPANPDTRITAGLVENFLCLTIADGVHLNVNGKIGVGGELFCQQTNKSSYINGPYGRIHMEEGSLIQLNSGSFLYAWGMITGDGNIIVKNNAEVHEMFQVGDMKSASNLATYYNNNSEKFFPITQYGILNIEVPTTYYYNSRLIGALLCYYPGLGGVYYGEKNVKLVGTENALFEITTEDETTWVRKSYKNARQVWDINSSAKLGSISINISVSGMSSSFNSANYILPITYNMDMHVLSGDFEITHNAELLPGSTIEIDKTASLTIKEGQKLYVFDKDQWPLSSSYDDAAINVHGNINVEGSLYTSNKGSETSKTDGANVYSNNADAGTIFFENAAPSSASSIDLITSIDANGKVKKTVTMDPALLKNGTGASQPYTPTSGTAANHSFAYMDNEWTETYTEGCFEFKGDVAYAKPGDYVALKKQRDEVGDYDDLYITDKHTYLSTDESRIFIQVLDAEGNCQWWEVEETSDPTVFECKKTGYEGFYYYDTFDDLWKLKTVNVDFYSAEEGDNVLKTIVTDFNGVPDQSVIATNPSKGTTAEYTYQFYGWKSSATGTEYPWTATLEVATADMSYRPVFTATKRNYTVTFVNANNGASVPVETPYGEHPTCTPVMDATAQYTYYFLNWTDASSNTYAIDDELPAVEDKTTYTAHWAQVVNKYAVTWKNGEDVIKTDTKQEYGAAVSYSGANPTKEMDSNYKYEFDGWSLTDGGAKLTSLPTVSGDMTFYAHYIMTPRYAITFANYDGTQLQKEAVTQGTAPIYKGLTPARARDYDGYYKFIGWMNSAGDHIYAPGDVLPEATSKETYTAQYDYVTELYLITLNNVDGNGASWEGKFGVGSTPFYNPNNNDIPVIPEKEGNAQYSYPFTGWTPALQPVSGPATYTAQFGQELNSYTITFANVDGNGAEETVEVEYGSAPACPVTPTKADACNTYAHTGWSPAIQSVTGEATYTAVFSETPDTRTFAITFDGDNDVAPVVMNVDCGSQPAPATPTKEDAAFYYTFTGWSDGEHVYATADLPIASAEVTYTAQYSQTLRTYTIAFVNYDGTPLQSSNFVYGATPTYSGATPEKPTDVANKKKYTFNDSWSPAITTVTGEATYSAQFNEVTFMATVTPEIGDTYYATSWSDAMNHVSNNCTLKLYANVTNPSNNTSISQNMTIDLNGYTISLETNTTSNTQLFNVNNVALTIDDSGEGGSIYYKGTSANSNNHNLIYRAIYVTGNSGKLTVKKGVIKAAATGRYSGGSWWSPTYYYSSANAVYLNSSNSSAPQLDMQGGELLATETYNNNNSKGYAVYFANSSYGHATVSAGKLNAKTAIFQNGAAARTTLTGGYYNMDVSSFCAAPYYNFTTTSAERSVVGNDYTNKVAEAYNITFNNWNGTALSTLQKQIVGTTPAYTGATPTKEPQSLYNFIGWKNTAEDFFAQDATLPAVTAAETYTAQYEEVETFDVDGNAPMAEDASVVTTTVTVSGTLEIDPGVTLTTTNLILEASESASGQITETGTITAEHVYFDWTMNGTTGTVRRTWYAIATPWEVDAETGISIKDGRALVLGRDFDLIYYSGEERALVGNKPSCWKYVEYDGDKTMVPGRLYMMYFAAEGIQTIRFAMKDGADIRNTADMKVYEYAESTNNDGQDANWNGIANPRSYYASLEAGNTYAQVLNNGNLDDYFSGESSPVYQTINLASSTFRVGKPLFVQSTTTDPAGESVVVNKATTANIVNAAPRRKAAAQNAPAGIDVVYEVTISADGKPSSDNLFVQAAEDEKADKYVIGKDLSKGGVAAKRAQMWIDRYDTKLSVNTQMLVNDEATYPLVLFAPTAGDYTISNIQSTMSNEDYDLYLTLDGEAIWNLSNSAYTLSLPQGNTAGYGLRISRKKGPQVATGIDEAIVDANGEIQKVLINGKVFIIRGNNVYSVHGQLIR